MYAAVVCSLCIAAVILCPSALARCFACAQQVAHGAPVLAQCLLDDSLALLHMHGHAMASACLITPAAFGMVKFSDEETTNL